VTASPTTGRKPAGAPKATSPATAAVIIGAVALCVGLWRLRGALDPEPPPPAAATASAAPRPATSTSTAIPTPQPAVPELPPAPVAPDLRGNDTVDPCTSTFEAEVPPGYDTATVDGVTVAWQPGPVPRRGPYDVALQPTAIAYLVKGLLVEAAALTGTLPRERIAVIIYASPDSFQAATHAPAWSGGVYNGGAVSVPVKPSAELGVEVAGLRHELMHAQLHSAIGCMPAWFNEGLAMYFAGAPPLRGWLRMLRNPDTFDLGALQSSTFAFLPDDRAERAYAQSLAMIVYLVDRAGELGLRNAAHALRELGRKAPRAGLDLWDRLYPATGQRAVADVLAHKLFGVGLGNELDAIFQGVVCCHGVKTVNELACRSAPPRPDRKFWIDQASTPRALCDATW